MSVVNDHHDYFQTVKEYNAAPGWQKDLLLRGTLLTKCSEAEPEAVRRRFRLFWQQQAAKRGLAAQELQTWA